MWSGCNPRAAGDSRQRRTTTFVSNEVDSGDSVHIVCEMGDWGSPFGATAAAAHYTLCSLSRPLWASHNMIWLFHTHLGLVGEMDKEASHAERSAQFGG